MKAKSSKDQPKKILRRITFGNQVTLPPHFMKKYGLHVGDHVEVFEEKDRVIIQLSHPSEKEKQRLMKKVTSFFKDQKDFSDENEEDILDMIDSERQETRQKR